MAGGGGRKNYQGWLIEPRTPVRRQSLGTSVVMWVACGALIVVSLLVLAGVKL